MMPEADVRREIEDLGTLIAACRERSRALREEMLTYYLDMAVDTTGQAPPRRSSASDATERTPDSASDASDGLEPCSPSERRRQLVDLRTMVEGCRDRALDVDEGVLSYVLDMALLTICRTLTHQA